MIVHRIVGAVVWLIALAWLVRIAEAHHGLPQVADLLDEAFDRQPSGNPTITVIVPARNEANDIRACLESLLAQDYPNLRVIAVDDRSTDSTGGIMHSLEDSNLIALTVDTLPPGWLGKTHAMALAARQAIADHRPDFLLFTDADILFRPDALRRALVYAQDQRADHLVVAPTTIIHRWDEAALISLFQVVSLGGMRPWRVADPAARDAVGVGAFNMIRTDAYLAVGGFDALRMAIVEDLGLGRCVKQAGLRQRMVFGPGLVRVHWASGIFGLIGVLTKNIFAIFNFHVSLLLAACAWVFACGILPFVLLVTPGLRWPGVVTLACLAYAYVLMARRTGLPAWNVALVPFAALFFIYAMLRSAAVTLAQGGVTWRGTFYPLAELRRAAAPLRRHSRPR